MEHFEEGSPKLWVITQALKLRLERPTSFDASGTYSALEVQGPKADHVIAYQRSGDVIAVVPRFPHLLTDNWSGTSLQLPAGRWTDRLSGHVHEGGATIRISTLLDGFPVALLVKDSDKTAGHDVRMSQTPQVTA